MTEYLGKSQPPSPEHPLGLAVCGTPITPGLAVWTNDLKVGTVKDDPHKFAQPYWNGWFEVITKPGATHGTLQNWERVITVFEGRKATDEIIRRDA